MATLSGIITPTNVLTATSTNTVENKTIDFADNTFVGVQPTLISGTNIKTVNGASLLGSGNISGVTQADVDQTAIAFSLIFGG